MVITGNNLQKMLNFFSQNKTITTTNKGRFKQGENSEVKNSEFNGNIEIGTNCFIENVEFTGCIKLGNHVNITRGAILHGNIEIDDYTVLSGPSIDIFTLFDKVKIGKYCSIARQVTIQEGNHQISTVSANFPQRFFQPDIDRRLGYNSSGNIEIGNDVWIGAQAVIVNDVTIGDGAIVGANALVNKDVPPFAIVAGVPAKVIRFRFEKNIIDILNKIKWWNLNPNFLKDNLDFFNQPMSIELAESFYEKISLSENYY